MASLEDMDEKIQDMKKAAAALKGMGRGVPALEKNVSRILASLKMLELNISDLRALDRV